ncbi:hypothetical protein [Nocardia alni]|uniref:hypothetical protein n=1 Tax=Nocardia alni TaxID=2815723 RepID=UPI001C248BF8|nr:hypothetical protein [Nocardia alni]
MPVVNGTFVDAFIDDALETYEELAVPDSGADSEEPDDPAQEQHVLRPWTTPTAGARSHCTARPAV